MNNHYDENESFGKNTITYEKDWQEVSQSEYPHAEAYNESIEEYNSQEENSSTPKKKKDSPRQLLITVQLIVCIIIALAAFALKNIGGEIYSTARDWYYTNLSSSAIFDGEARLSLQKLFGSASPDEV